MSQSSQHRTRRAVRLVFLVPVALLAPAPFARAAPPVTGLQNEVKITAPTRLDWQFAASGFGKDALKLPTDYDSRKQRYQLYVPEKYEPARPWPLVVFVSPGDDPLGWRAWQKTCEAEGGTWEMAAANGADHADAAKPADAKPAKGEKKAKGSKGKKGAKTDKTAAAK